MNTEVSTALSTLEADPRNKDALEALRRHSEAGANGEREAFAAALAAARALHAERGELELVLELIDRELALTTEPKARADLLCEKARLLQDEFARCEPAEACVQEALQLVNGHPTAAKLGKRFADEEAEWEKTAQTRVKQAKEAGNKPTAAPHFAAAGELYLRYRPKSSEGEAFLKRALEIDPKQRRSDLLLERVMRSAERWDDLADLLARRAGAATSPDDKAAAEALAAEVASLRGRDAEAIEHFKRALQASPGEPRALRSVVAALSAGEEFAELVKVYEGALRAAKKGQGEMAILLPLANLTWKKLGNLDQAELHFRRIRKIEPLHPAVLEFYREYHLSRGEIQQLLALLTQAQKAESDPARRIRIGVEMAEIAESRPQSAEKAIDIWKGLLRIQPGLPEATAALRRLYGKTEKWNALLEMLKDQAESLPKSAVDAKIELYLEMIPIYRDRLKLDVMVTNTFNAILQLKPDHREALRALAERHEGHGRWSDLVDLLQRQAAAATDPQEKVALYQRAASLWAGKLGKPQNAVSALEMILKIEPRNEKARASLKEIHTRARNWHAVVELARRDVEAAQTPEQRRERLGEMARLAAERLNDARQAISLWNERLAIDANDREALTALAGLYERGGRAAAWAEVLGRLAALTAPGTDEAAALLEKRAELLAEKLDAAPAAEATLIELITAQPGNARALRALRDLLAASKKYDDLEALYASRGAYEELMDAFNLIAERTDDTQERVAVLARLARVAEQELKQPDRAISAYEKIIGAAPRNMAAARALLRLYRRTERWSKLIGACEALLDETPAAPESEETPRTSAADALTPEERIAMLAEARLVSEERLGSKALAFQWASRAYDAAPADGTTAEHLERLAAETGEWEAYAARLNRRLEQEPPPKERVPLLRRLLKVTVGPLRKPPEARRLAEALLALVPNDPEAESALEKLLVEAEEWAEVLNLWHARIERLPEGRDKLELLVKIAAREEAIGDRVAAEKTLRAILERKPDDDVTLVALERVAEGRGDARTVAEVLRRQLKRGQAKNPLGAVLRLGKIYETDLGSPAEARASYLEALELDPVAAEAVAGLERLSDAKTIPDDELPNVLTRLVPYYELTENYGRWAAALERLVELNPDVSEKLVRLELLVDLYGGPLNDPGKAFSTALRMFDLDPRNYAVRERLFGMMTDAVTGEDLASVVRTVLDRTEDTALRAELLGYLATIEERRPGGGPVEAEKVYRELLKLDPLHGGAFRALTRLYQDAERWRDLRDLLEIRESRVGEAHEKQKLLAQIAEIDEALLDDHAHAIETLKKLLEISPDDLKLIRSLGRHLAALERWKDYAALLEREEALVSPAEVADLRVRRAELLHRKLDRTGAAIDLAEEVLTLARDHLGVRRLLEEIMPLDQHRQRAAVILEPLYEAAGEWQKLVETLEVQTEARDPLDSAPILARIAELQEARLDNPGGAFATWRRVLAADPGSAQALGQLERLAPFLDRYRELIELYDQLAARQQSSNLAAAADLLGRAARVELTIFGDRAATIRTWRRVMDLDPDNPEIARPAAESLEALYAQVGDFRGYVEVLRLKVEWTTDARERGEILRRIAEIEEKSLGDLEAAIATLRSLADSLPDDPRPLVELERLFTSLGQHRNRIDVLRKQIEMAETPAAREPMRFRAAELLERELGDVDEAISTILAVLDENAESREALEILAGLYEKKGATNERLEILERRLVLAAGVAERAEVLRDMAALLAGPLARPSEALERWRDVLGLVPADATAVAELERLLEHTDVVLRLEAARALEPLYQSSGAWAKLARLIEIYIAAAEDSHERMTERVRLAELQEMKLLDPASAFASYAAAIRDGLSDPQLERLLDAFETLGQSLGPDRSVEVIDLYRSVEADVLDEALRLRMMRVVAERAEARGDVALAVEYNRRIVSFVPDDRAALDALERLYREGDDLTALHETLQRKADLAQGNAPAEVPMRLQVGGLAERLGRSEEAIAAFERVWLLKPGDAEATAALDRLYTHGENWTELCGLLERRLALLPISPEALEVRFRLAQVQGEKRGDKDAALAELGLVLKLEPDHASTIALLESMLSDEGAQVAAANLLEPIYIRRQAWQRLVAIDELRLKRADDPDRRFGYTQRIARVYEEQIEDFDQAFVWYGRVFRETPEDRSAQEQLLRLAPKLDKWRELAQLLDDYLAQETANTDDVLEIVRLDAMIHDERLGDRDAARRQYRRAVDAAPGDTRASRVYEASLERWQAWEELRNLLDEQSALISSPSERKAYLRRSAMLSAEKLGDRARAADAERAVLDIDPTDDQAAARLEALLRSDERWNDVREHLVWRLEHPNDATDVNAIAFRLADVEETRLGEVSVAIERYGDILTRAAKHGGALAALERRLTDPDHRGRVAQILEPHYRRVQDARKLADVLEVALEMVSEPERRSSILTEIALLEESLGRLDRAVEARGRAWLEEVSAADVLSALEATAAAARLYPRFVEILTEGAAKADHQELQASLWALAASVMENRLGEPARAIEAWRSAIAARPDSEEAYVALERLLAQAGRAEELAEIVERHLEIVLDAERRKGLTKRLAILVEEALKDRGRAVEVWRSVLEIDGSDMEALDALARLYTAAEEWRDLVDILQRKIELEPDLAAVRAFRFQSAQIYDEKLSEQSEATAQLRAVLDAHPDDEEALAALDTLFAREGRDAELLEILDMRSASAGSEKERIEFAFRAAALLEKQLGDPTGAIDRYRSVLERSPRHEAARAALWALARQDDYRFAAVSALEPVLRAGKEWPALVELLELRLQGEMDPPKRYEILVDVAHVLETELQDPKRAFSSWAAAFAEAPAEEAPREALERVAEAAGDFAGLAKVYEERLGESLEPDLEKLLAWRLAEIHEHKLKDPAKAVEFLNRVADVPGEELKALSRLEALLGRLERYSELETVLERESEIAADIPTQAGYLVALGDVRLGRLDSPERAVEAYRSALERVPEHGRALGALRALLDRPELQRDVIDILEPLAEARADYKELARLYELRASMESDHTERAAWLRRIADIAEERLSDKPRAAEALARAVKEDPLAGDIAEALERLVTELRQPAMGAQALEEALKDLDGSEAVDVALRAARLYEASAAAGQRQHEAAAERLYKQALAGDAENTTALDALEEIYRRQQDEERLAAVLEQRAGTEGDPDVRRRRYGEAALLRERRGDVAGAIAAWQAVREAEEGHPDASRELARLYEAQGRHEELVKVLEERANFTDARDERISLLRRIGDLKRDRLSDVDGAASAYRDLLDTEPGDRGTLEALAALEAGRGDFSAYEEVLLRRLGVSEGDERTEVLFQLVRNAEDKLEDADRAVGYLHQIREIDPINKRSFEGLVRIFERQERWHELVDLLETKASAEETRDPAAELETRLLIADIWGRRIGDEDSAREAIEKVLARKADHSLALLSLAAIEERAERWPEAAELLERAARSASTPKERAEVLHRRGRVLAAQGADAGQVEAAYKAALDADPTHRASLEALEEGARAANDHARLAQLLDRKLAIVKEPVERKPLLVEVAALYGEKLGQPAQAITALRELAAATPNDAKVQEDLGRALIVAGQVGEAEQVLKAALDALGKARQPKAVARVQQALGALAEKQGQTAAALQRYEAAYQLDPAQPAVLAALGRLAMQQKDAEKARRYYRSLLLQTYDEKAVGVTKADIYLALGKLHAAAKEIPKARNMFERGLESDPKNAALKEALAALPK